MSGRVTPRLSAFRAAPTILVDAGGLSGSSFDIGDRVVAPVLRAAGVRRLDAIVLTHGDPDHIGGAAVGRFASFGRGRCGRGSWCRPFEPLRALRAEAQAVGAAWVNLKTGDRTVFDDVEVMVRHPDVPDWERQKSPERRFDRDRAPVARRLRAVDRRHRPGGRANAVDRHSTRSHSHRQDSAPWQPDVEHARVRARRSRRASRW